VERLGLVLSLSEAGVRSELRLVRIPVIDTRQLQRDGITPHHLAYLVAEFRREPELPLEYPSGGVAGWLRELESQPDADGILWGRAEFTSEARRAIAAGEYKRASGAVEWVQAAGRAVGCKLSKFALMDGDRMPDLPKIALSTGGSTAMNGDTVFNSVEKLDAYFSEQASQLVRSRGLGMKQAYEEVWRKNPTLHRLREELWRQEQNSQYNSKTYAVVEGQLRELDSNLDALTKAAMQAHPELTYGQAFQLACSQNRDLVTLREAMYRLIC
jgi:hypothetical protein